MLHRLLHRKTVDEGLTTFLIAGLGNPGREYRENRHNFGFMLVDRLCRHLLVSPGRVQSKALVATSQYAGHKIILAKPQTFMNLSGQAVGGLMRYYKIPIERLLLAYDDLDLPLGTIRLRPGGGSSGQKGVASTIQQLGTPHFARLRLGIGRPPGRMDPAAYVLQDFTQTERQLVEVVLDQAVKAVLVFIESGLDAAMNQFNGSLKEGNSLA